MLLLLKVLLHLFFILSNLSCKLKANMLLIRKNMNRNIIIYCLIVMLCGCVAPKEISIETYSIEETIKTANIEKGIPLSILKFNNLKNNQTYSWLQNLLADVLITNISASNVYKVVLRNRLEEILKEQQLQLTGIINETTAVKIGNIIGAKVIIIGSYVVNDPIININVKFVDVGDASIISSVNMTGDLNDFSKLEEELTIKMFKVLSIEQQPKRENLYSQIQTDSIKAIEYNYKGEEYITRGEMKKAIFELWKAMKLDPDYEMAIKNYSSIKPKDSKQKIGLPFIETQDKMKRRIILMEVANFIYEEIKRSGIRNKLLGEVEIRFGNQVGPVPIKVPIKFWLSDHIESFLKRNAEELGGNYIDNPNDYSQKGFKLKLTYDNEVNKYFNKLLADSGYYFIVLFKNYNGKPLNKERKFKIPDFFKSDEIGEELFVVCEPTIIKRKYTFASKKASLIEEIQTALHYGLKSFDIFFDGFLPDDLSSNIYYTDRIKNYVSNIIFLQESTT